MQKQRVFTLKCKSTTLIKKVLFKIKKNTLENFNVFYLHYFSVIADIAIIVKIIIPPSVKIPINDVNRTVINRSK